MKTRRIICGMLTASIMAAVSAGCGSVDTPTPSLPSSAASPSASIKPDAAAPAVSSEPATAGGLTYPVEGSPKVTYWVDLNLNVSSGSKSMNDTPLTKQLIADTGIQVEYIHPTVGQQKEGFNLLIASGDLPDIVEYAWLKEYPGGPELAFKNKLLTPLNESLDQFAPDYKSYLDEHPDVAKYVRTDEGNYFGFPFIRGHEDLMVFYGPMVRKDWIDELGIAPPETIEEWYVMLKAFKEKKGCTAPLTYSDKNMLLFDFGFLSGAWGATMQFNLDGNDQVVYGPAMPEFKEFLKEMNKWYSEGLIDANFYTNDRAAADSNILNNKSGAVCGYAGSGMGKWIAAFQETDPKAEMAGLKYPALNKGETPKLGQKDTAFMNNYAVAGVTANSKNKEAAFALLNYGFTEKGDMLYNFGIEGESYTMEDGYPTYTEAITKPSGGSSMSQMLSQYTRSAYNGPFVQRLEYYEQYMQLPAQKEAITLWKQTDALKYQIPPVTPTQEESKEYNAIVVNMNNWRDEWCIGAITGAKDVEKFDEEFIGELKNLGLDRAVAIQQGAYERFKNR